LAGARQVEALLARCAAILYPSEIEGSLGRLACIQQGQLHSLAVYDKSGPGTVIWQFHRTSRTVDVEPYGPDNSFKPTQA
jgi:hypothetical protein